MIHSGSKHAESCKDVPFGSVPDGRPRLMGQIPPKLPTMGPRYTILCIKSSRMLNEPLTPVVVRASYNLQGRPKNGATVLQL